MTTNLLTTAERFVTPQSSFSSGRTMLARFSRSDVQVMLEQGVIPEDATTELLDGMIFLKDRAAEGEAITSVGQNHRTTVVAFAKLCSSIDSSARHVESQQPLFCREDHVPEPDFMVIRGTVRDYTDIATAPDAFCVVEVADSSYERDSGMKLADYARADIAQYIIINLRNRTAEIYTQPNPAVGTYPPPQLVAEGAVLSLRVGEDESFEVPLVNLLP